MLDDDPHTPGAGAIGDLNPVPTVTWGGAEDEERDRSETERARSRDRKQERDRDRQSSLRQGTEKNRETGRQREPRNWISGEGYSDRQTQREMGLQSKSLKNRHINRRQDKKTQPSV